MYIIIAVMGSCFTGASATSHAFLSFSVPISSAVGGARVVVFEEEEETCFLFPEDAALNPGGSGIPVDFGFAMGGLLRSITHCGGGGGGDDIFAVSRSIYA